MASETHPLPFCLHLSPQPRWEHASDLSSFEAEIAQFRSRGSIRAEAQQRRAEQAKPGQGAQGKGAGSAGEQTGEQAT